MSYVSCYYIEQKSEKQKQKTAPVKLWSKISLDCSGKVIKPVNLFLYSSFELKIFIW